VLYIRYKTLYMQNTRCCYVYHVRTTPLADFLRLAIRWKSFGDSIITSASLASERERGRATRRVGRRPRGFGSSSYTTTYGHTRAPPRLFGLRRLIGFNLRASPAHWPRRGRRSSRRRSRRVPRRRPTRRPYGAPRIPLRRLGYRPTSIFAAA